MKAIKFFLVALLLLIISEPAYSFSFPEFLPDYYKEVFPDSFASWTIEQSPDANNIVRFKNDQGEVISIKYTESNRSIERSIFISSLQPYNDELTKKGGQILNVGAHILQLLINEDKNFLRLITIYATPKGVFEWEYKSRVADENKRNTFLKQLLLCMGRHRYEEALFQGNVAMGFWGPEIHQYAKSLSEIDPTQAIAVYENHLKTSPNNYETHLEYMKLSDKDDLKSESAKVILRNAEEERLLNEAAKFLGKQIPSIDSFPILEKGYKGLQVILIPLLPCNPWLLKESAEAYEEITGIPVKILRLTESWHLKTPDRIPYQRNLEQLVANLGLGISDFTGWDIEKFRDILLEAARREGPFAVYSINKLFEEIEEEIKKGRGQWKIDSYLVWFQEKALLPHRTDDIRTMYVGITEADIYSGDTNFLFSQHDKWKKRFSMTQLQASILSYARMLSESTGEPQSRKRLVGRIAKELVPASLKSLDVPRSTDPTCPYSYADGIERLDEKTFELSEHVKEAIQKYKDQAE